jgi:hypothetical protein
MREFNNLSSGVSIIGEITAEIHEQKNKFLQFWNQFLERLFDFGLINRETLHRLYAKGKFLRSQKIKNVIANVGFNVLAALLAGEYADTGAINKMALGDGVGTPDVSDETLFNEVYRNEKASSISSVNIAIITAFYTESEVDGTFTEFGNFIDGEAGADTGLLWSHVNVSWTKSDTETLTVQCKYTITNKP